MTTARTQFIQIPLWVLDHPRVASGEGGTVMRVYCALLGESSFKTRVTKVPVARLMERTNLGKSVVYKAMTTLREIGAVQERADGSLRLPLDDPTDSATVENSTRGDSATVEGQSATVDSESATAETLLSYIGGSIGSSEIPAAEAARPSKPTDDPLKAQAHALAVLAMEQPVKPEVVGSPNAFPAVMAMIERHLRSGKSVQRIRAAIATGAGVEVWTFNGLATAIAKARPASNTQDASFSQIQRLHGKDQPA